MSLASRVSATLALGAFVVGAGVLPPSAGAQQTAAPAASAAPIPSSPAKKELVQRLVALQQGSLDGLSRSLVEGPARQIMAAGEPVLQTRVPPEKREAAVKAVQEEVRKYIDGSVPLVRERAGKLSQSLLAPAFDEKFTEDELRQIVTFLESPANKKFQQSLPEISDQLARKLVTDSRPQIDPKVKALEAGVAKALGVPLPAAASAPAGKPAAASGPVKAKP